LIFGFNKLDPTQFLKRTAPKLRIIDFTQESIIVKEQTTTKTLYAEIKIRDNSLYCDLDDLNNCKHIRFCLLNRKVKELVNLKEL